MYQESVELDTVRLAAMVEPILMLGLGFVTAFVMLSTALPTIRLLEQV